MEILRFGPGFRSVQPPVGSSGLADQSIWSDPRARVTELAFSRRAVLPLQSSPDLGLFVVVAGGGWVQIGEERSSINHGEAVEWPPGVVHGAWTDGSPMRAILVEVADHAIEASHVRSPDGDADADPGPGGTSLAARGRLAPRDVRPEDHDTAEGEPW